MTSIRVSEDAFDIAAIRLGAEQCFGAQFAHIAQRLGGFSMC
jgi:hypothetical protein